MTIKEFQIPYLFMLRQENEDKNNDYNYRLISNIFLNESNFDPKNDHYLYIFGLFPCKYIPSAYIPFNYKKLLQNIKRINPKDIKLSDIFTNEKPAEELKKRIEKFINKGSTIILATPNRLSSNPFIDRLSAFVHKTKKYQIDNGETEIAIFILKK